MHGVRSLWAQQKVYNEREPISAGKTRANLHPRVRMAAGCGRFDSNMLSALCGHSAPHLPFLRAGPDLAGLPRGSPP